MRLEICLLVFLVSLCCLSIASEEKLGGRVGGWTKIDDIKDPHVTEIGRFAVTEYNKKSKSNLKFERVVSGESQVVAGTNYKLVLVAKDGQVTKKFEAVVYERPWEHYQSLTSFQPAK